MFQEQERQKNEIEGLQEQLHEEHDSCVNLEWDCEALKDEWSTNLKKFGDQIDSAIGKKLGPASIRYARIPSIDEYDNEPYCDKCSRGRPCHAHKFQRQEAQKTPKNR